MILRKKNIFALIMALVMMVVACACASADAEKMYSLGDTVEDFDITLSDGTQTTLYKLLDEKKAVFLNFWASWCGPCMMEFPYMSEAAAQTTDVAVVALSVEAEDTDDAIATIQKDNGLEAIMMGRDAGNMYMRFSDGSAVPVSVLIDKNHVLCYSEIGSQPSTDAFTNLFSVYTDEAYDAPVLTESGSITSAAEVDVDRPAAADAAKALGISDERITVVDDESDDTWPFVVGDGCLMASNSDVQDSTAHIELSVNVQAGEALKYEYMIKTEAKDVDVMAVLADSESKRAYVDAPEWQTGYIKFDEAGEHSVDIIMVRGYDETSEAGLRSVSILTAEETAALEAEKPARPEALSDAQGLVIEPANAEEVRTAEYAFKSDDEEFAEPVLIAGTSKTALRIRIGADVNPELAMLVVSGSGSRNVILADLPSDDKGYIYECDLAEAADEMGAIYMSVCDDVTDVSNYVGTQVYNGAEAVDAMVAGINESIKSTDGDGEMTWHYTDDAE